jgi:hypothetical protein
MAQKVVVVCEIFRCFRIDGIVGSESERNINVIVKVVFPALITFAARDA